MSKSALETYYGSRRPRGEEDLDDIGDYMIAHACSLSMACKMLGFHQPSVWTLFHSTPELALKLEGFRAIVGDSLAQHGIDLYGDLRAGVDPAVVRVALDVVKWSSGQMAPKHWGEGGRRAAAEEAVAADPVDPALAAQQAETFKFFADLLDRYGAEKAGGFYKGGNPPTRIPDGYDDDDEED